MNSGIGEVLPGSVSLTGDVAVFSVEGGFCASQVQALPTGKVH
jgi:hypothetical protein